MINKTISHYKILEKLGGGGMGVVYKARDLKLDRFVALKFLRPELSGDDHEKKRLIIEAKAASAIEHKNICTVHEIGETEDGQLFIAMAFYSGETLKQKIERAPVAISEALKIGLKICDGLQRAHEEQIVHRDIKPANIFVTDRNEIRIMDFGVAKIAASAKLTVTGSTVGTVSYMSPEQARGQKVDHRADIWSFGVLLYELLTGQQPFEGENAFAVLRAILEEKAEPVTRFRGDVPMALEQVIDKCLAKDPRERYQHMNEIAVDLQSIREEIDKGSKPARLSGRDNRTRGAIHRLFSLPKVRKERFRSLRAPTILLLIIISVAAGFFFFSEESEIDARIPVAVVDFVNETDEPELNGLSGLLITALEQSRHLSVLTRSRMFDILKQLNKTDVERIDEALGREICKQAGINAMALASVRRLGDRYVIDLKVLDPNGDRYLFTGNAEGEGQHSILSMIDELAERTRKALEEKHEKILASNQPVVNITTPNLEAYYHFFKGEELVSKIELTKAIKEFEQAIELDKTFGLAYFRLAELGGWIHGQSVDRTAALRKAMALIDRIPEKERFLLRAEYAMTDGYQKALNILQEMEQLYPDDKDMLYKTGDCYFHLNQYTKAVNYLEKVLNIDPLHGLALQHLAWTYQELGRLEEMLELGKRLLPINEAEGLFVIGNYYHDTGKYTTAAEYFEKAAEIEPIFHRNLFFLYQQIGWHDQMLEAAKRYVDVSPTPDSFTCLAEAYALVGDFEKALQNIQYAQELSPQPRWWITRRMADFYMLQGDYKRAGALHKTLTSKDQPLIARVVGYVNEYELHLYLGKYSEASQAIDKAIELASEEGDKAAAAGRLWKALLMVGLDDMDNSWRETGKTIPFHSNISRRSTSYWPHFFYLSIVNDNFESHRTTLSNIRIGWLRPWVLAINSGLNGDCTTAEVHADTVFQASPADAKVVLLYHLSECYLENEQLDKAEKSLHRLLQTYSWNSLRAFLYPKSLYVLGQVYEKKGDIAQAIQMYEKFLDLWKEADPDLPELADAKSRLADLKAGRFK